MGSHQNTAMWFSALYIVVIHHMRISLLVWVKTSLTWRNVVHCTLYNYFRNGCTHYLLEEPTVEVTGPRTIIVMIHGLGTSIIIALVVYIPVIVPQYSHAARIQIVLQDVTFSRHISHITDITDIQSLLVVLNIRMDRLHLILSVLYEYRGETGIILSCVFPTFSKA